ncbi:MAG: hypothetical protein VX085_10530, partial [Pseudomonadota bacterium]|nr:hypothetical protein [Pseudomonadota bacterium]
MSTSGVCGYGEQGFYSLQLQIFCETITLSAVSLSVKKYSHYFARRNTQNSNSNQKTWLTYCFVENFFRKASRWLRACAPP